MKQSIMFAGAFCLFILFACKKDKKCKPAFTVFDNCERFDNLFYPNLKISEDADAWYSATIEDEATKVSTEFKSSGIFYWPRKHSEVQLLTSSTSASKDSLARYQCRGVEFSPMYLINQNTEYTGKQIGLLGFYSPEIPKLPLFSGLNLIAWADTTFKVGVKKIDNGVGGIGKGWNIALVLYEKIGTDGSSQFETVLTNAGSQPSQFNLFEITKVEKKDLGDAIRYFLWIDFQVEVFTWNSGERFGKIENGKAKIYIDIDK